MPEVTWNRTTHNPQVAGSNPARATKPKAEVKAPIPGRRPRRAVCKRITQRALSIAHFAKPQVDGYVGVAGLAGLKSQRAPQSRRSATSKTAVENLFKTGG